MMKYFNQLAMIFLIFGSSLSTTAIATPRGFASDSASDMLRGNEDGENENADTSSRWGTSAKQMHAETVPVAKPIAAIDDSSFASETNRAPASMREPAGTVAPSKGAKKPLPSAKTMVRTLKQKKAYQEAAVIVNDLGFFPSTIFVTQGIPVRLFVTGASQKSQCMILDAYGIRRQIKNQKVEEVTFTPEEVGKFSFSCPMNGAKGTIIVKELQINDRFPASEPITTSMAKPVESETQADQDDSESAISDSDFGTEFRLK